jgi:hypothetical protein
VQVQYLVNALLDFEALYAEQVFTRYVNPHVNRGRSAKTATNVREIEDTITKKGSNGWGLFLLNKYCVEWMEIAM